MGKPFFYLGLCLLFAGEASAQMRDSATAAASSRYSHPNIIRRLFIGGNYRKIWATPVRMEVFHMETEKGGLTITKLGGGMQTKSLRFKDRNGTEWTLRTVDKTVDKAMEAEGIKSRFVKHTIQDMISAADPYGALTISPMAAALEVVHTPVELFFVPDDPAFGEYRKLFANAVCTLEEREPVAHTGDNTEGTKELRLKLEKEKAGVDAQQLLQARLLDMLIGDWDRHDDQWLWGKPAKGSGGIYYPIPRDHDQAYFNSNGLLVRLVRPFTMQHIVGFREESKKLKKLNRKEWKFDRLLLKDLTEADWKAGITRFQARLTDDVLEHAVKMLPPEIYSIQGPWLLKRLRGRRDSMMHYGMKYYRFLMRKVPIPPPVPEEKKK